MTEKRSFGPTWPALAVGFGASFSALSGVLTALVLVLAMGAGSVSVGSAFLAAGAFVLVALGRLPDATEDRGWADWLAAALFVIGALWCLSEPWRGAPVQYTTLLCFALGSSWAVLFGLRPAPTGGSRVERWAGVALGSLVFVGLFWPWLVAIFARALQFAATPTVGVAAEILTLWVLVGITVLVLLSIAGVLWFMDRSIGVRERREIMRMKANG